MQKLLLDLWNLLQPILLALSMFFATWLSVKLSRYLDAQNAEKLQIQLREAMRDATSYVYQQKVKDIKDPSKPGIFDKEAQKQAAQQAINLVLSTHSSSVEKARSYGIDPTKLLQQLVERAVFELGQSTNATLPPAAPQVSTNVVTVNASTGPETEVTPASAPTPKPEIESSAPEAVTGEGK